jgi:hypothetical protein
MLLECKSFSYPAQRETPAAHGGIKTSQEHEKSDKTKAPLAFLDSWIIREGWMLLKVDE